MTTKHFQNLFKYDAWCNEQHLVSLEQAEEKPASALRSMAHVFAARRNWLQRIRPDYGGKMDFYPELNCAGIRELMEEETELWSEYLSTLTSEELGRNFDFSDTLGNPYRMEVQSALAQVALHSAHHRGQVASALRAAGAEPADADFYLSEFAK
ncbi:MAG: DinB family protein [Planctomycetes bacterium]|nr:DinB family protein [Planctomycetota bacterium]